MSNLKLVVRIDWSIYPVLYVLFSWLYLGQGTWPYSQATWFHSHIDSFNVTVKWIETLFPMSKTEVDKIYSDVQSFAKAVQSNLYVYDLSTTLHDISWALIPFYTDTLCTLLNVVPLHGAT